MDAFRQPKILVLGIGNILWADEGFGVRALELFNALYAASPNVSLLDGGTQDHGLEIGLGLFHGVEGGNVAGHAFQAQGLV